MKLIAVAVAVVLAIALLFVVSVLVFPMAYSGLIEDKLRSSTNYNVSFSELDIDLLPLTLLVENLEIAEPSRDAAEPLATVATSTVTVDLGKLLSSKTGWWALHSAKITVVPGSDSEPTANATEAEPSESPPRSDASSTNFADSALFQFSEVQVTDFELRQTIEGETSRLIVSQLRLQKDSDERLVIDLTGDFDGQPLSAEGHLALPSSERATDVEFDARLLGGEVSVTGTVGHDGITPGEARINARYDELGSLGRLVGQDLDRYAPLTITGSLQAPEQGRWSAVMTADLDSHEMTVNLEAVSSTSRLELRSLRVALDDNQITATGVINTQDRELHADLDASRLDIDAIMTLLGNDEPSTAPEDGTPTPLWLQPWLLDVELTIAELVYQPYHLASLDMALSHPPGDSFQLSGKLGQLSSQPQDKDDEGGWKIIKPVVMNASLSPPKANASAWHLAAEVSTEGVSGKLAVNYLPAVSHGPVEPRLEDAHVELELQSLAAVDEFETATWDPLLPIRIETEVRQPSGKVLVFEPLFVKLADSEIRGELRVDSARSPISVNGGLRATLVDINRFATSPESALEDAGDEIDKSKRDVIGNEPIDWSWLDSAAVDFELEIDRLMFNETRFANVRTRLVLKDHGLQLDPLRADLAKGGVRGHLRLEPAGPAMAVDARLIATELTPADLGKKNAGLIDGGETDLMLNVNSAGSTPQEFASGLSGEIALEIQRATIRNSLFEVIGSDIVSETISLINPFVTKDKTTELECAAIYFKAVDGVLESPDQLVIETSKVKIRGGGTIDLNDETLLIDFVPSAQEGLGVGLGSLSSVVRLGGTLGNPTPEADPKGIFKAGATIGAAIASGGVSLLAQGLFDRARNVGTACGKIFENVPETEIPQAIDPAD